MIYIYLGKNMCETHQNDTYYGIEGVLKMDNIGCLKYVHMILSDDLNKDKHIIY